VEVPEPISLRCSALVVRDEQLLVCHREADDAWVLPGGSPHRGEGARDCAEREVPQETGIAIRAGGVALVFDVTNPGGSQHLFEIVFEAEELHTSTVPTASEDGLVPTFVALDSLDGLPLRPSIGGQVRTFAAHATNATAPYLGNLWRPTSA